MSLNNEITLKTFRFTFGNGFTEELSRFAKVHQFDDRVTFKEAWTIWIKESDISSLINIETKRLSSEGFTGDVLDKMYKSARYYYRKKPEESKSPRERKEYIGFSKDILSYMDENINNQLEAKTIIDLSPSDAFDNFCDNYKRIIMEEMKREKPDVSTWKRSDVEGMTNRFKKAYKNRFYKKRGNQERGHIASSDPSTPLLCK